VGFLYRWVDDKLRLVRSKVNRYLVRLLILLLVTLVVAVPTTYLAAPHIRRWQHIRWLTSTDLDKRQRGLLYVAAQAQMDDAVRLGAVDRLGVEDDTNFMQIVDALQAAGRWSRRDVPAGEYLRWVWINTRSSDEEAVIRAVQRLADISVPADDDRIVSILREAAEHPSADVRYNTLCVAATLYKSAKQPGPYHNLFRQGVNDADAVVAHHAALFAYLTDAPGFETPAWLEALPTAAADRTYDEQEVRRLLWSPDAPLRDVGCVLAARDLSVEVQDALIEELLQGDGTQKITGALLAGVSGRQNALLTRKLEEQTDWDTAAGIKLGMWMQGKGPYGDLIPSGYLARDDMPRSSVIMAMLSKPDAAAYEALLNPSGEAPDDLIVLLESYGWWRVLNHYLLEGAPRWTPTDEPTLQQYQADLLRDWYLVHRHEIQMKYTRLTY